MSAVPDLTTLAGQFRAQATANSTIVLDGTVFPNTVLDDIRAAFALAADANLVVNGVTADDIPEPVSGTLTVSAGTASVLHRDAVGIVTRFTTSANSFDAAITVAMGASWKFNDSFASLDRFPFSNLSLSDAVFVYTTKRRDDFPWPNDRSGTIAVEAGLNFLSHITFGDFPVVSALLGELLGTTAVKFYGPFTPAQGQQLPVGKIRAPLGSGSFHVGVAPNALALGNPAVAVRVGASGEDSAVQNVDLVVEADFNDTLRVSVAIPVSGGTLGISAAPLPNRGSITSVIESLPGGSGFTSHIPSELSSVFANVALDSFTMVVDRTPAVTFLGLSISTLQPWPVIPGVLVLEGLALRIEVVDPTGVNWMQVAIDARAQFLPNIFTGDFDFTVRVEKQTSWEVSTVSGSYVGEVSLGKIVGGLLGDQSSVPAALRAIEMSNFGVSATRTGPGAPFTYRFHGSAEIDFPVLDTELNARLDLSVTKTATGHTIQLDGGLMIGEEAFTVDLDLAANGSRLNAKWTSTGPPLQFGDIANALGWHDMPALPDGLDLSLKSAAFSYDFTSAGLTFTAASEHYGQVVFVTGMVNGRRVYLFDLHLPLDVKLSDIPVAGRQIPSSVDVGIRDLEIAYASTAFTTDQVTAVNAVLQTLGASPLRPATFPQGMMFSGVLHLGNEQQPLSLPLSGSVSQAPRAITASTAPARSSGAWVDIGKSFGPLRIDRVGMQYANGTLTFALDAGIALGPLMFSIQGLAIGSSLTEFDPVFSISGLGLAYSKPPLEIAGAILRVPDDQLAEDVKFQFDGMLVLKAANFSLAAIGSYAQLTSGAPSLFVFAQLEGQLGGPPAFFVTGLMAGFGFNRTLAIPAQDEVASFPLLRLAAPPEPGSSSTEDPTKILQVLEGTAPLNGVTKAWITPKAGEYWLAAGLEFTSFELVSTKALLVVEFGSELTIALLGLSTMQLPQPAQSPEAYAFVEMMIRVIVQPTRGVFAATAILSKNSYVITPDCHLTGGFAFYLWFGDNPNAGDVVVTLGGYHPAFKVPSHFPQVPRLGFNWAVSDVVSIKGEAYFALTTSCVMAGGGLEVLFNDGDLRAWFIAHADFLVSWHPFFYLAEISVSIGVSYRLSILGCHKTITAALSAHLNLWGPPTGGIVRVNLVVVSFTVRFGTDSTSQAKDPLAWHDFQALLPDAKVLCRVVVTDGLYKTQPAPANSSGTRWIVRAKQFAFQTRSAIPASHLTYGDKDTEVASLASGRIAIKPMNLSNVTSTHTLKIYHGTATTPVDTAGWTLTSLSQAVPESLWGSPPAPFTQIPAQPSANVIPGQLSGLSVTAPKPKPGAARGPIAQQALLEDYLSPAGRAPLSTVAKPSPFHVPSFDEHTIGLIGHVMDPKTRQSRDALFAALSESGVYSGPNGDLSVLAADAGHLFSDPPMRQN
jgi:uncharacterized protein DUF6603